MDQDAWKQEVKESSEFRGEVREFMRGLPGVVRAAAKDAVSDHNDDVNAHAPQRLIALERRTKEKAEAAPAAERGNTTAILEFIAALPAWAHVIGALVAGAITVSGFVLAVLKHHTP